MENRTPADKHSSFFAKKSMMNAKKFFLILSTGLRVEAGTNPEGVNLPSGDNLIELFVTEAAEK